MIARPIPPPPPLVWAFGGAALWLIARRRERRDDPLHRAREVLAERFARDELTAKQYRERLAELERTGVRQA